MSLKDSFWKSRGNVIHILTSLDFGGVERHMEIVATEQASATMVHHFVAIGSGGAAERTLSNIGVPVECLGQQTAIPNWGAVNTLQKLLRKIQPAVVHTHGAEANFHGLIAAWLVGVPVRIGEEIGIPRHGSRARIAFRQVYRAAHRVIGISDAVTRWLVESGEVPANKAMRVYNPVRLADGIARAEQAKVRLRIGFVGRLEPVKNPLGLVQAVRLAINEGAPVELWLIGDGSERKTIEAYIKAHGLSEFVRLLGFQSDPSQALRSCDLYVQPSISEGFGLALVEAMGLGLPVIATAVGGAPEFIEHGRTGWLLSDSTAEAVAKAIGVVAQMEPTVRIAVGRAAAEAVRDRFEPGAYLREIELLYREALGERYRNVFL